YFQKYRTKIKSKAHQKSTDLMSNIPVDKLEEWKDEQWDEFLKDSETDFEKFNDSMGSLTISWFEKKELEWEGWIKAMRNRWSYYNKHMDDCTLNVIKNSLNWTDFQWDKWIRMMKAKGTKPVDSSGDEYILDAFNKNIKWTNEQWKEWIKTPIRLAIEKDWAYWIAEDQYKLDNWILENFDKWQNKRIGEWKERGWKYEEDKYWDDWETKGRRVKSKMMIDKKNWKIWKERKEREDTQWDMWIEKKKKGYLSKEIVEWTKWKAQKGHMFKVWVDNLIDTWIREKQWNVWLHKEKEVIRKKMY
ncbi:tryptophan-rich antigen, partial [Plasmodium gonderi]